MARPYEIGRFVHLPGKYVVAFHVSLSPECLEKPGILVSILNIFAKEKISIVNLKFSRPKLGYPLDLLIFADLTGCRGREETLAREIESLEFVDSVQVTKPVFNGLTVCNTLFPLTLLGERAVIFRRPLYEAFIKRMRERMGTGYTAILYYIGCEIGRIAFSSHQGISEGSFEALIAINKELFRVVGFGSMEIIQFNPEEKKAIVRVWDNFECELFKGSSTPQSNLIRGMLAGWLGGLFNTEMYAQETKCIALSLIHI